jgi:hypothetical protein
VKRIPILALIGLAALALLFAQQGALNPAHAPFEMLSVFPRETSPGQFDQVDRSELRKLAEQGWELVGVTPFIYRNEEHKICEMHGPKPVVTLTCPAYFFKRPSALSAKSCTAVTSAPLTI